MTKEEIKKEILDDAVKRGGLVDCFYKSNEAEKAFEMMKHCIGLDRNNPYHRHGRAFYRPYRNRYSAGPEDLVYWQALLELDFAWRHNLTYHLTRKGLDFLGDRIGVYIYDEAT